MSSTLPQPAPAPVPHIRRSEESSPAEKDADMETMPPPPRPDSFDEARLLRTTSSASRNTNRLSLTLPIAPPTSCPTRPTPTSSNMPSYPPTPVDTSALTSPVDPNDFITAIAAQERRVLELREELSRAESDLSRLKKDWTTHEAMRKRAERRNAEPLRSIAPPLNDAQYQEDETPVRRSSELDRRKALWLNQQGITPTNSRRRMFRGGHARTLSLLSPVKTTDTIPVHEDPDVNIIRPAYRDSHPYGGLTYRPNNPALSKRASWNPRSSTHGHSSGVKQIAEDFKVGLWTFVEDLRQVTVGEQPITGVPSTNVRNWAADQATIRASGAPRPRASAAFEDLPPTPAKSPEKTEQESGNEGPPVATAADKRSKHWSWTPLTIDSFDDTDWASWDSTPVKSPRWSGSTLNGEAISPIPEKNYENETPLKKLCGASDSPQSPATPVSKHLEELAWPALNRLTPSSIKRTTSDLMNKWEQSLASPDENGPSPLAAVGNDRRD